MKLIIDLFGLWEKLGDEKAMQAAKDAGFDGIDYWFTGYDNMAGFDTDHCGFAKELKSCLDAKDLICNQVHAPYSLKWNETLDMDTENYRHVVYAIECAAIMGAKRVVVHAITVPKDQKDVDFEELNLRFYRSLIPYCERFGVKVAVENLYVRDPNCDCYRAKIGGTAKELCDFIRKIGSPWFTACLDLGHIALVGSDVASYLREMDVSLFEAIHIHDNDYHADSHTLPYLGKFDWDSIMDALRDIGYKGDFTFEIITFLRQFPAEVLPDAAKFSYAMAKHLSSKLYV